DVIVDFRIGRDKVVLNAADVIEATPGLADFVVANGGDGQSVLDALDDSDDWSLGTDDNGDLVVTHPSGSITFKGIAGDGITSFTDIGPALSVDGLGEVLTSLAADAGNPASIAAVVAPSGGTPDDDNADFDLLLTALNATELTGALANEEASFTVFAPTDAAFISLAQRLGFDGSDEAGALDFILGTLTTLGGGDPIPLLSDILLYHVSDGAKTLGELQEARTVDTLFEDADLRIGGQTVKDQDPDFDDAMITQLDVQTGNGIIQVIDEVLLPFDV
ncbi:MAG: fasciclin domain-containing protein, partial [Pseudomonadota bacterium]